MGVRIRSTDFFNDANLQGYWELESDGSDSGPNEYDLSAIGTPTHTTGQFGNGVDLESSSSQAYSIDDASCPNLEISGSQTWILWFKAETVGDQRIVFKRGSVNHGLYLNSGGYPTFILAGLTTASLVEHASLPDTDTWYFMAGVYDSSANKLKIWINDTKTEVTASGSASDTNGNFAIGRNGSTANLYWDGMIDDVAIFNRALSDAEIASIYDGSAVTTTTSTSTSTSSSTSTSTSTSSTTTATGVKEYSRGDETPLGSDDTNLETLFNSGEYEDVETSDDVRVAQTATDEYAVFLFKDKNDNSDDAIDISWEGQSDKAPSTSTVYLQIYNRTSESWVTLDSDDSTGADTDFTLNGTVNNNLTDYYDNDFWVSCRVYQEAV